MTETVISIKTEKTPNPDVLKYNFNRTILPNSSVEYINAEAAKSSPLALRIFKINAIERVFIGTDFIALTKKSDCDWSAVNSELSAKLEDFFESDEPAVNSQPSNNNLPEDYEVVKPEDQETFDKIAKILKDKVSPAVQQDGGDIVLKGYKDKVVYVQMLGACNGCPSSTATLKNVVENTLKYFAPEAVEQIVEIKG